jgi:hypothetical protein
MTYAFDTLGYSKRLRDAGISTDHAEAHAEAAREFVMGELVTKTDLDTSVAAVRHDLDISVAAVRHDLDTSVAAVRHDLDTSVAAVRQDLDISVAALRLHMDTSMASMRRDFRAALDIMGLRLTVRLGAMLGVGIAALAALIKL